MKIAFHGATQTVTGSKHLISLTNGKNILLDCGMFQGKRDETYAVNLNFPFDPRKIDAMVLTHAHIDHSGNIPNLVKQGFAGRIYCTYATRDLCSAMLLDSGHIQESDVTYVNNKRRRAGQPPVAPAQREGVVEGVDGELGLGPGGEGTDVGRAVEGDVARPGTRAARRVEGAGVRDAAAGQRQRLGGRVGDAAGQLELGARFAQAMLTYAPP